MARISDFSEKSISGSEFCSPRLFSLISFRKYRILFVVLFHYPDVKANNGENKRGVSGKGRKFEGPSSVLLLQNAVFTSRVIFRKYLSSELCSDNQSQAIS